MADDDSVYSEGDEEDSVYPDSIRFYMLLHHSLLSKPVLVSASLRPGTGTDTPLHLIHENTNKMYDPATACHRPAAHRPPPIVAVRQLWVHMLTCEELECNNPLCMCGKRIFQHGLCCQVGACPHPPNIHASWPCSPRV